MKILFLSLEFPPMVGGISSAGWSMTLALRALGHDVHLLLAQECAGIEPGARYWLRRPRGTLDHRVATRANAKAFLRALDEVRPDIVYFSDASARLVSLLDASKLPPYLVYVYGTELITPRPFATWLSGRHAALRRALDGAARIVCVSGYTQGLLREFHPPVESQVVYTPYDADKVGPLPAQSPSPFQEQGPQVLSVCRLAPRKNVGGSMRIMAAARAHVPGLQFHIVGAGPERPALEALAAGNGWQDWVHFHGKLPLEELKRFYNHADAYIMCSRTDRDGVEGLGLTYIEATMSGCLAIGTSHGGAAEVIQDKVTGLVVDPENIPEAVEHILPYLQDAPLRKALRDRAAAIHGEKFGMPAFRTALGKVVASMVPGP